LHVTNGKLPVWHWWFGFLGSPYDTVEAQTTWAPNHQFFEAIPGLLDSFPRDLTLGELGGILVGKVLGFGSLDAIGTKSDHADVVSCIYI